MNNMKRKTNQSIPVNTALSTGRGRIMAEHLGPSKARELQSKTVERGMGSPEDLTHHIRKLDLSPEGRKENYHVLNTDMYA